LKILLLVLLLPIMCYSQQSQTEGDNEFAKMQAIADTMHFPDPFEYKYVDTSQISSEVIYARCLDWIKDSLNKWGYGDHSIKYQRNKIIIATIVNQLGVGETLTIEIQDGGYMLIFDKGRLFENKTDGLKRIETIKDSPIQRFTKYYTSLSNFQLFNSIRTCIRKGNTQ
jgi:hypothetical protein